MSSAVAAGARGCGLAMMNLDPIGCAGMSRLLVGSMMRRAGRAVKWPSLLDVTTAERSFLCAAERNRGMGCKDLPDVDFASLSRDTMAVRLQVTNSLRRAPSFFSAGR